MKPNFQQNLITCFQQHFGNELVSKDIGKSPGKVIMNSQHDAEYRLRLAKGFQQEAEQDFQLQRWRSCVDNAQLSEEHFLTDYGDEKNYKDPWSLFNESDAQKASDIMQKCLIVAEAFYQFYYPQSPLASAPPK